LKVSREKVSVILIFNLLLGQDLALIGFDRQNTLLALSNTIQLGVLTKVDLLEI